MAHISLIRRAVTAWFYCCMDPKHSTCKNSELLWEDAHCPRRQRLEVPMRRQKIYVQIAVGLDRDR